MAASDSLLTDDMELNLDLNFVRFNEAKAEHAGAANKVLSVVATTFGNSTSSITPGISGDGQSEFLRRKVLRFTGASTSAWTLAVPTTERIFDIDNQCTEYYTGSLAKIQGATAHRSGVNSQAGSRPNYPGNEGAPLMYGFKAA